MADAAAFAGFDTNAVLPKHRPNNTASDALPSGNGTYANIVAANFSASSSELNSSRFICC